MGMDHKTQETIVIHELMEHGRITRNWCLKNYISRLGAIIYNLKKVGWVFEAGFEHYPYGKDFVYKTLKSPLKKAVYRLEDGTIIGSKYEHE